MTQFCILDQQALIQLASLRNYTFNAAVEALSVVAQARRTQYDQAAFSEEERHTYERLIRVDGQINRRYETMKRAGSHDASCCDDLLDQRNDLALRTIDSTRYWTYLLHKQSSAYFSEFWLRFGDLSKRDYYAALKEHVMTYEVEKSLALLAKENTEKWRAVYQKHFLYVPEIYMRELEI